MTLRRHSLKALYTGLVGKTNSECEQSQNLISIALLNCTEASRSHVCE